MPQNISPADSRRVVIFERFVRNANHLLKKKSAKQINKIIDDQVGFLRWIKDSETRDRLLTISKELRDTALDSLNNFDDVMKKLKNCEQLVKWKTPQEITKFFDNIDRNISKMPDQRVKLMTKQNSSYWRTRWLDEYYITSSKDKIDKVSTDKSIAWKTTKEVEAFFAPVLSDISKINNEEIRLGLFDFAGFHKADAIQMIEFTPIEPFPEWLNGKNSN